MTDSDDLPLQDLLPDDLLDEEFDPLFEDLPDDEVARFKKRMRAEKRTQHIRKTCSDVQLDTINQRRDAIAKERRRIEKSCEAAPGPFAVPVRVTRGDIGCQVIFLGNDRQHMYGELESCNTRTIHPSDGTSPWKARIIGVRGDDEDGQRLWGVHDLRIVSKN